MRDSEKWVKLSKMGRSRFVLLYGVLGWGVPTAILFSLLRGYERGWAEFPVNLVLSLIMFPLAGIVWGRWMWKFLERRHGKASRVAVTK
jgi:hypothetical protein